jgi:cysteinyl-tRNA synthetase
MPGALAVLHETLATRLPPGQKLAFLRNVDPVLGLDLIVRAHELSETSAEQRRLLDRRAQARAAQDWATSDSLRSQLAETGLEVKDTPQGQRWVRRDLFTGATPAAAQV